METKELYSDSQQQAVNMKILESRKRMKEIQASAAGGDREQEESRSQSPGGPGGHMDLSRPTSFLDLAGRPDLGRPPLFMTGPKYEGFKF